MAVFRLSDAGVKMRSGIFRVLHNPGPKSFDVVYVALKGSSSPGILMETITFFPP